MELLKLHDGFPCIIEEDTNLIETVTDLITAMGKV